jgi:isopentenyldiphosphate isomerase
MSEKIEIFDLKGNFLGVEEREKFYSEIRKEFGKKKQISRKVKSVRIILMNSKGRIYLQKRSKLKNENPGLYDKTVGGHVLQSHTYEMTVVRECAEELGIPASVLSEKEFEKALSTIDVGIVGVFKKVDFDPNFMSIRITKDSKKFVQPYMTAFYVGYYDGAIKFVDGESTGIEVFSIQDLVEEIRKNPGKFTEDIKFMIKKYKKFLKPIK